LHPESWQGSAHYLKAIDARVKPCPSATVRDHDGDGALFRVTRKGRRHNRHA
jgi:hypothetical protein